MIVSHTYLEVDCFRLGMGMGLGLGCSSIPERVEEMEGIVSEAFEAEIPPRLPEEHHAGHPALRPPLLAVAVEDAAA